MNKILEKLHKSDLPEREYNVNEKLRENSEKVKGFTEKKKLFRKEIKDTLYNKFLKEYIVLNKGGIKGKFRTYMLDGKVGIEGILEPKYEDIEPCSENYIWVREGEKRGLVDVNGDILIDPEFDRVLDNMYEMDDKRGFINENGEALEPKYDLIIGNNVMVGNKVGLVGRKTGRELIEPKYDDVRIVRGCSIAKVWIGKKCGLVSTIDGSVIKEIEYDVIIKDKKIKTLKCKKGHSVVDEVDYNIYEEKKD